MDLSPSGIAARALRARWFVRAPIGLYRHGLGWIMGGRILMLEHTGRTSGEARFVCLEIVERPADGRFLIVSGFGERAQWYRNLRADPHCFVSTGRMRRAPATAHFLPDAEARQALGRYAEAHPRDWEVLRGAMEKALGHPVDTFPMVELRLDIAP